MQIYYKEGPPTVTMGAAGTFVRDVSRDVDDKLAEQILKKKTVVFYEGESSGANTGSGAADTGSEAETIEEEVDHVGN